MREFKGQDCKNETINFEAHYYRFLLPTASFSLAAKFYEAGSSFFVPRNWIYV